MAAGWLRHLARGQVEIYSGGSEPAADLNPAAVTAMAEVGIDISAATPTRWDDAMLQAADVIVTMGCGDTCPVVPGKRYVDWPVPDPAGRPLAEVRPIRDEIAGRVRLLLDELGLAPAGAAAT
jgi:protein-tyrosine-phosphatase